MAKRTTRNKIRWQVQNALDDIHRCQDHLGQAAALANNRSEIIDNSLPAIMTSLELTRGALESFYESI